MKVLLEQPGVVGGPAEIDVFAVPLSRQVGVDLELKVVEPFGVEAVAAAFRRQQQPHVVQMALHDDDGMSSAPGGRRVGRLLDLAEDVDGPAVVHGVNGVEPQAVKVVVFDPEPHVVEDEIAHGVGTAAVVVEGRPPRR